MGEPAGGFRGTLDATHPNEVTEPKKKSSRRRQSGRRRRPASKRVAAPPVEVPAEPTPAPVVAAASVEPDAEPVPEIPVVTPEIAFAARPFGAKDDRNAVQLREDVQLRNANPNAARPDPTCT